MGLQLTDQINKWRRIELYQPYKLKQADQGNVPKTEKFINYGCYCTPTGSGGEISN